MKTITSKQIRSFEKHLFQEEKAAATIQKYTHDIREFARWLPHLHLDKNDVIAYKRYLAERYAPASVNAALSSLNSFFHYMGWHELKVKNLKLQKKIFAPAEKELSKSEYELLLQTAKEQKAERLYLLMQTICSTGIRISELRYISVEAVNRGVAEINCKGKRRQVILSAGLCQTLKQYAEEQKIKSGAVFITKNGNPVDRSNVWSDMKKLCTAANVSEQKVFPHNLRHLFARTYYDLEKDVVRLADLLGHSSINTTRIYTMECGEVHRRQIQQLGLLPCEYSTT